MKLAPLIAAVFVTTRSQTLPNNYHARCKKETYYGPASASNSSAYAAYEWDAADGDGVYYSRPLCMDESYDAVRRYCFNGAWYPKNVSGCFGFDCPHPFAQQSEDECLYVTGPQPYDVGCPKLADITSLFTLKFQYSPASDCLWFSHTSNATCTRRCWYKAVDLLRQSTPTSRQASPTSQQTSLTSMQTSPASAQTQPSSELTSSTSGETHPTSRQSRRQSSPAVEATLRFDARRLRLFLTVYSPEALDAAHGIQCFTNEVDARLRSNNRLANLTRIYDSRTVEPVLRHFVVDELHVQEDPAQYWCRVFQVGRVRPVITDKVVAYRRKSGNEYSLHVALARPDPEDLESGRFVRSLRTFCPSCRLLEVFRHSAKSPTAVLHYASNRTGGVPEEFKRLRAVFAGGTRDVRLLDFRSSDFCLPGAIPLGSSSETRGTCPNGLAARKKCGGDFMHGAEWEEPDDCPAGFRSVSPNAENATRVDVASILNGSDGRDLIGRLSKAMALNEEALKDSQISLNVTDRMLDALDNFLADVGDVHVLTKKSNLMVLGLAPLKNNVTGLALYRTDRNVRYLKREESHETLAVDDDLDLAVVLPEPLLRSLSPGSRVKIAVFGNDRLFPDGDRKRRAGSKIARVFFQPDFDGSGYLAHPVLLLFGRRSRLGPSGEGCGLWDYGQGRQGRWTTLGGDPADFGGDNVTACWFSRQGHYGFLVDADVVWDANDDEEWRDEDETQFSSTTTTILAAVFIVSSLVLVVVACVVIRRCWKKSETS